MISSVISRTRHTNINNIFPKENPAGKPLNGIRGGSRKTRDVTGKRREGKSRLGEERA
jgi:hypothetical protein